MKRIYVNEQFCIGCHLCEVYCQAAHSQSKDLIKAFKRESSRPLTRIRVEGKRPMSFSVYCQQCNESPCVQACLTGALTRDPVSSVVKVDEDRCMGCWTCVLACPLGVIRQDTGRGKIVKCDLCAGKDVPMCVMNCPNEALVYEEVQDGNPNVESKVIAAVQ